MVSTLVKLLELKKTESNSGELKDLVKGYEEFEKVCSMWNTYIYMHDYTTNRYEYLSPTFCHFIGIPYEKALTEGFSIIEKHIHPEDSKILNAIIFTKIEHFLANLPIEDKNDPYFKFNYTFRLRRKDGTYAGFSVSSKVLKFNKNGKIELDFGLISPNTFVRNDNAIVFTISKSMNDLDYVTIEQEEYLPSYQTPQFSLTDRELEIVKLLQKGLDSNEISNQLCLSLHTVKNHRRNIFKKTNTNKVTELLTLLNKTGI